MLTARRVAFSKGRDAEALQTACRRTTSMLICAVDLTRPQFKGLSHQIYQIKLLLYQLKCVQYRQQKAAADEAVMLL